MLSRFISACAIAWLPAHSLSAYTFTGSHWGTSTVTMQLQLGASTSALSDGSASWGASAEDALTIWNSYIASTHFAVVRDSTAAKAQGNRQNNVFFSSNVYGSAWGSGVLAVTLTYSSSASQTTECDVLFNSNLSWDSYRGALRFGTSGTVFDFHRVALHEFGHVLGLDHPDQGGQSVVAMMNSRISNLDVLASDDISGAQSLYGTNSSGATVVAPSITAQPASQTVNAGQNVSFSVTASGSSPLSYQWLKNGAALGSATNATLNLAAVTASSAGNYSVTVSNSAGAVTSATATLTVNTVTAPTITTQPASRSAAVGSSVTFSVTASGTSPFSYVWRKNGVAIAGATQSSYTLSSVQQSDAANYTVVVTNSAGSATSTAAALTVTTAPVISSQPTSQTITAGSSFTLSVAASGSPTPSYQWQKDGTALAGATTTTYAVASARSSDAGSYAVRVSNANGAVTSSTAVITVNVPPTVTIAPAAQTISAGTQLALSVAASGSPAPTYQWQKNGSNLAGETQSQLVIASAAPTDAGTYSVVVTNAAGTVSTVPVLVTVNYSQLVNLSTRGYVPAGGSLAAGFVLRGSTAKSVIVRGVGPTLNSFGVTGALADPRLSVVAQDTSETLAVNDSWSVIPQLSTAFQSVGAFPLPTGSADAASQIRLTPGAYSTWVTADMSGTPGIALAEIYDAEVSSNRARLVNVSTLAYTGSGENALIAGFTIQGNVPKRVLIRAIGPTLTSYGVLSPLANPRLDVYPLGQSSSIAGNDDWDGTNALSTAFTTVAAFQLPVGSRDAALVLSLSPGGYSVVVTGVGGATGYALIEIYDLDP